MAFHGLSGMLQFLDYLRSKKIPAQIMQVRDDSLMVSFAMVGYRVEVSFFESGIEYSVFTGHEDVFYKEAELLSLIESNHY